ncbi:MAG: T9SS type A sorting domain-containing protein [Sphingobacteriales bacterium]|nr:MAG: T9SS type A sorting domain-containing protein [Sphingobacteriales bacterium]
MPAPTSINNYGTQVTGPGGTPNGPNGLDGNSPGYSVKAWNASIGDWSNVAKTDTSKVNRKEGYYLFARGDRRIYPGYTGTSTTLRSKGTIRNYADAPVYSYAGIPAGTFTSVANPYASSVSLDKFITDNFSDLEGTIALWDPTLSGAGSAYGVGGYQTVNRILGQLITTPAGTPAYPTTTGTLNLQSGQAMFVRTFVSSPAIRFTEDMKENGSRQVNRGGDQPIAMISTMLYPAVGPLKDGNRVVFNEEFSDAINRDDSRKTANAGINFGLIRNNVKLAVETRTPLKATDTLFYNMSGLPTGDFRIGVAVQNIVPNGLKAELIDKFLNTRTAVSLTDSSFINFSTTAAAASKAADRFMLVFKPATPVVVLPVNFISVSARRQADRTIAVNWKVANEINIVRYEVERSAEGVNFSGILTKAAAGTTSYDQADISPLATDNFYRIKAIGLGNDISYSAIVKVNGEKVSSTISVYPNPFVSSFTMSFAAAKSAPATLQLVNMKGQVVHSRLIQVLKGSNAIAVDGLPDLPGGSYQVIVTNQDLNIVGSIQK